VTEAAAAADDGSKAEAAPGGDDTDGRQTAADLARAFADGWESTLRTCVQAVVAIRVNLVRSFDTERATSMQVCRPTPVQWERWESKGAAHPHTHAHRSRESERRGRCVLTKGHGLRAGDGLCSRRDAWPDSDEPPRGHPWPHHCRGRL
jgi:hypothetical protein